MCTVGEKEGEERWSEREIPAISPPFILWAQMSSPNEKKWDAPNQGRKHFVLYMFSLPLFCLSFCHCLVFFSSAYHIQAIASGGPRSWSHQLQISHRRMNTASGARPDTLSQCWQLYHSRDGVSQCLLFCAFVGVCGHLQTPMLQWLLLYCVCVCVCVC